MNWADHLVISMVTSIKYGYWYDPKMGKWISEDPIGFAAGDTNLGRYVGNASTFYYDPTGLDRRQVGNYYVKGTNHHVIPAAIWDQFGFHPSLYPLLDGQVPEFKDLFIVDTPKGDGSLGTGGAMLAI